MKAKAKRTAEDAVQEGLRRQKRSDPVRYDQLLATTCEYCHAKVGEFCRTQSGKIARWHVLRTIASKENNAGVQ